tara:strand:+ start:492 stop:857 length:366 start_codon:yes stop_codon:yes gene_type:complete
MSVNQIIQTNVSNFHHFVETHFAVENDTLIYNLEVFKKLNYEGKIPDFLEELKEYYYKNKHYYLSRTPITFNNFNTIMRQIMNKNEVPYEKKVKYTMSKYQIEYHIPLQWLQNQKLIHDNE